MKPMTKEEKQEFDELKQLVTDVHTALVGNDSGATGVKQQIESLGKTLSQHVIDDNHNFGVLKKDVEEARDQQKKLKWFAGGIAAVAGLIAWVIENLF